MKRDMELVRAILLTMEAHAAGFAPHPFTIAKYDQDVIGHHVWLMAQGDLVTASEITGLGDASPTALPLSITWQGHDFLDTVRNDRVWRKLKTELKDRSLTLPFSLLQALALKIAAFARRPPVTYFVRFTRNGRNAPSVIVTSTSGTIALFPSSSTQR